MTVLGASIGALFSGLLGVYGRRSCLLIFDVLIIVGSSIQLFPQLAALCAGRFIYGLGVGGCAVYVPKFITETAPIEIKGPAGALTQICSTVGILLAFIVGLGCGVETLELSD